MAAGGGREVAVRALNVDLMIGMGHHGAPETTRKLIRLLEPVKTLGAHRRGLGAGLEVVLRAAARLWAWGLIDLFNGCAARALHAGAAWRAMSAARNCPTEAIEHAGTDDPPAFMCIGMRTRYGRY